MSSKFFATMRPTLKLSAFTRANSALPADSWSTFMRSISMRLNALRGPVSASNSG